MPPIPLPLLLGLGAAVLLLFAMPKKRKSPTRGPRPGPGSGPPAPPEEATRLAPLVAANTNDRALVRAFQAAAGIDADGIYGPQTKGALRYWLNAGGPSEPPPPHSRGSSETPYTPGGA